MLTRRFSTYAVTTALQKCSVFSNTIESDIEPLGVECSANGIESAAHFRTNPIPICAYSTPTPFNCCQNKTSLNVVMCKMQEQCLKFTQFKTIKVHFNPIHAYLGSAKIWKVQCLKPFSYKATKT